MTNDVPTAELQLVLDQHPLLVSVASWVAVALWITACIVLRRAWGRGTDAQAGYVRRLRDRPWSGADVGLIALSLILLGLVSIQVAIVIQRLNLGETNTALVQAISGVTLFHIAGVALLLFIKRARGWTTERAFGEAGRQAARHAMHGVLACVAILPVILGALVTMERIMTRLGVPLDRQDVVETLLSTDSVPLQVVLVAMAVVIAPVAEELIFRGVALPFMVRHFGVFKGILLVSLMFAIIHFNLASVVPITILAVGLGYAYLLSGSLITAIAMHATFNSFSLLILLVARSIG